MSEESDFKLTNIIDSTIDDMTSEIVLGVMTGGAESTYQNFPCNSPSMSQLLFNVQIPNMSTALSRKVFIQSTVTLKISFDMTPVKTQVTNVFFYGDTDALQAFPINSLCNNIQCTINNANTNVNTALCIAPLLKLYKPEELEQYSALCPSLPDCFVKNYIDAQASNVNVLSGYKNASFNNKYLTRGCFPVTIIGYNINNGVITSSPIVNGQVDQIADPANPGYFIPEFQYITLQFTSTEPLLFLLHLFQATQTVIAQDW